MQTQATKRTVLPGETIGILGGGQLGRMMALAARNMGYRIATLDPTSDSPCGQVADEQVVAGYTDVAEAEKLARQSAVVTYEFENVDADVLASLQATGYVPQGSALLRTTQHRVREKQALADCGTPIARYLVISSEASLNEAVSELGLPLVLKTAQGGYDGKGQWLVKTAADIPLVWQQAAGVTGHVAHDVDGALIAEAFVPFVKELSVIVARNPDGQMRSFPVAENIHVEHILHMTVVPARIADAISRQAQVIAERIAVQLGVVGLIAVEMFLTSDDRLYVNELAPRPHNSGHFTMDACATSQFEQHVRGVCNLPLGSTRLLSPVVMVNILGEHLAAVLRKLPAFPDTMKLHLYGKHEAKPKRKMGHINVLADSTEEAMNQIAQLAVWPSA